MLRPFWRYYGSKWFIAPRYPEPRHRTIIEPFAGAAGYSLRYPEREVILIEKYHVIAEVWRWLITATPSEVLAIPEVDAVVDLPAWVAQPARWLVGLNLARGTFTPRTTITSGMVAYRNLGKKIAGWSALMRARVAAQVKYIRHWRVIEGDYTLAPDVEATWFIDAPYFGRVGACYPFGSSKIDYSALGTWCRRRRGQVIVCEANDADWLPFRPFSETTGSSGRRSREAIWLKDQCRLRTA